MDSIVDYFQAFGKNYGADFFGRIYEIKLNEPKEPVKGIMFRENHFIVPMDDGWTITKSLEDAINVRDGKVTIANG